MTAGSEHDAGSAALTLILATTVCTAVAAAALVAVSDLAVTAARARTTADAAALAAAGASPLVASATPPPVDPVREARRVALANRARLVATDDARWPLRFTVTVEADPASRWVRRVVGAVRASATAGVRPPPALISPRRPAVLRRFGAARREKATEQLPEASAVVPAGGAQG